MGCVMGEFDVVLFIAGAVIFLAILIPIAWLISAAVPIVWPITLITIGVCVLALIIWGAVSLITWIIAMQSISAITPTLFSIFI